MLSKLKLDPALKWVFSALGSAKKWVILLSVVRILQGLETTFFAIALKNVIDSATSGNNDAFLYNAILLGILVLFAVILNTLGNYWEEKGKANLEKRFRLRAFSELLIRSYSNVTSVHSGEWMTRIISDTSAIVDSIFRILPRLLGLIVQVAGAGIALLVLLPQVTMVILPMGIILLLLSVVLRARMKALYKEVQKIDGQSRSFMQERLTSMAVVRTFTQEKQTTEQAGNILDRWISIRLIRSKFTAFCSFGVYGAVRGGYLLGVILCGSMILKGKMTYGTMTAILQLVTKIDTPLMDISDFVLKYFSMLASAERLMEIESYPSDYDEPPHDLEKIQNYYSHQLMSFGFHQANFNYQDDQDVNDPIIKNLDIDIKKGEYVAFTGTSGCGKSTALKLLMGLYPLQSGTAYLRDIDGSEKPLTTAWRSLFAYVPQGNHLISGTIREVITFGNKEAMKKERDIWHALKIACAENFVRELPKGLDYELGEKGAGLSEGQMQRIAIARAIFSGRPILMLDEVTSALDAETESQLVTNLQNMTDRTVILITHRAATLSLCAKKFHFANHEKKKKKTS